eukprot:Gb_21220 [translate_table: standard]
MLKRIHFLNVCEGSNLIGGILDPTLLGLWEQEILKKRLVLKDDFSWKIFPSHLIREESASQDRLHYVGGVDLSFSKDDSSIACGALVVVDLDSLCVVYEDFDVVHLTLPYIPGFLAFREFLGLVTSSRYNSSIIGLWNHICGLVHMVASQTSRVVSNDADGQDS